MVKITNAPTAKEVIKLERDSKELQPLEVFMGKLGTEHLQLLEDNVFELLKIGVDKFGDGFQLTDLTAVVSMYSPIKGISDNWEKAKAEIKDLDSDETGANLEYIADNILSAFNVELSYVGSLDTDNLQLAIDYLFDAIKLVKEALKDGVDWDDVRQAPELLKILIDLATVMKDAIAEAEDLSGSEIGDIAREFGANLHYLLVA